MGHEHEAERHSLDGLGRARDWPANRPFLGPSPGDGLVDEADPPRA